MSLSAEVLRHAREAGVWAQQASRGLDACPLYAMGPMGAQWRAEWVAGWESENAEYLRRFPQPVKKPAKRGKRK